jgi:hypothetical protein
MGQFVRSAKEKSINDTWALHFDDHYLFLDIPIY